MKKTILVILGIICLSITAEIGLAKDAGTIAGVEANYWMTTFDADFKITDLSVIGTEINAVDDLGVDDSEGVLGFSATLNLLRSHRFVVSYFSVENEGQKQVTNTFNYKGKSYTVGSDVTSKLDVTLFEGYYEWMLLKEDLVEIGFLLGAKYAQIDTELKDSVNGTLSESVEGPVPIIGVQGEVKFWQGFGAGAIAKGITINAGDIDFTLLDLQGAVSYDFNRFLRASAGYRYMLVDGTDGDNSAKVTYTGPFIGITGSF